MNRIRVNRAYRNEFHGVIHQLHAHVVLPRHGLLCLKHLQQGTRLTALPHMADMCTRLTTLRSGVIQVQAHGPAVWARAGSGIYHCGAMLCIRTRFKVALVPHASA